MAKKALTKVERAYFDRLVSLGCVLCGMPAEVHHISSGGLGTKAPNIGGTIPLCPRHHRTGGFGVAVHAGKQTWEKRHGREQFHVKRVNQRMGVESES